MTRQRRHSRHPSAAAAGGAPDPTSGTVQASRGAWALVVGSLALGVVCVALSLHAAAEHPAAPGALPPQAAATPLGKLDAAATLAEGEQTAGPPTSSLTQVEPDTEITPEEPAEPGGEAVSATPPETIASSNAAAHEPPSPSWHQALWHELQTTVQREQTVIEQVDQQQKELNDLRAEQARLAAELATSQQAHRLALSQLTVAETTREHLANELAQAQAEVSRLRQSVAFYERVIPATGESSRIQIRSAEVYPLGNNLLQYRVLVMRNRSANDFFQGELRFVATGEQDGSSATIPLERLSLAPTSEAGANPPPAENAAPGLRFQQYQRATGLLAIPPGFTPATITVRVLEGKAIRAEHTVTLAQESLT